MPAVFTFIFWVVAPSDQRYSLKTPASKVTLSPSQNSVVPDAVTMGKGTLFTVTTTGCEVPLHPPISTTSTVYQPVFFTDIL